MLSNVERYNSNCTRYDIESGAPYFRSPKLVVPDPATILFDEYMAGKPESSISFSFRTQQVPPLILPKRPSPACTPSVTYENHSLNKLIRLNSVGFT